MSPESRAVATDTGSVRNNQMVAAAINADTRQTAAPSPIPTFARTPCKSIAVSRILSS